MKQFEVSSSRFENEVLKYFKSLGQVERCGPSLLSSYKLPIGSVVTYKTSKNTVKLLPLGTCHPDIINSLKEISSKPYIEFLKFKRKPYPISKLSDVLKENGYSDFVDKKEISVLNKENNSMVNVNIGFLRPDYFEVFKFLKEDNKSTVEVDITQGFIKTYCPNCEAKEAEKIKNLIKKKLEARVQNEHI